MELTVVQKQMIEEFQCPGCMHGPDTKDCAQFKPERDGSMAQCIGHVPATAVFPAVGRIVLGLPKGFNRVGSQTPGPFVRCWEAAADCVQWNKFNLATWAMESDGHLFVRTYMPRINLSVVDVIRGGTVALCPGAVNVGEFVDEID